MKKRNLSRLFLGAGALLLLLSLLPTALTYPWKMLLGDTSPLPDPAPLIQSIGEQSEHAPATVQQPLGIDSAPSLFDARPQVALRPVGIIKIPRIRLSEHIVEGAGDELFYAVGRLPDSASLGQPGNCVLAGHRNYFRMRPFRYLDKLQPGDSILLTDDAQSYTYVVVETAVVTPQDTWVMQPREEYSSLLTLITCTPVLGMQDRLVVWAELQV